MKLPEITTVAEQYRGDGYTVVIRPGPDDLPGFLAGFAPDMVARKGAENVAVELITKDGLNRKSHFLEYWVGKVNNQPGWRFDLVITDPSPWSDRISKDARELDIDDVRERNLEVRRSLDHGFLEPALLFAWSLAEAAM